MMAVSSGEVIEGTVTKLLPYGAILDLPDNMTGLVHISEIAEGYVEDVSDYLREEDVVRVKLLAEKEPGRWELSIKQADPDFQDRVAATRPRSRALGEDFEKRLTKFMQESNRRQNEIRRRRVSRRGG